jgi:hypothetical protein
MQLAFFLCTYTHVDGIASVGASRSRGSVVSSSFFPWDFRGYSDACILPLTCISFLLFPSYLSYASPVLLWFYLASSLFLSTLFPLPPFVSLFLSAICVLSSFFSFFFSDYLVSPGLVPIYTVGHSTNFLPSCFLPRIAPFLLLSPSLVFPSDCPLLRSSVSHLRLWFPPSFFHCPSDLSRSTISGVSSNTLLAGYSTPTRGSHGGAGYYACVAAAVRALHYLARDLRRSGLSTSLMHRYLLSLCSSSWPDLFGGARHWRAAVPRAPPGSIGPSSRSSFPPSTSHPGVCSNPHFGSCSVPHPLP